MCDKCETSGNDFDAFLCETDAEFESAAGKTVAKPVSTEGRHPCNRCGGSGKYRGYRVHQTEEQCFACGGRGWFKLSYKDRMERNAKRKQTIADKREARIEALISAHPDVVNWIREASGRGDNFALSLAEQVQRRDLTENQINAVYRTLARIAERRAEYKVKNTSEVGDVSRIRKMFDDALAAGKNKRALLAARFERDENGEPIPGTKMLAKIKLTPAKAPRAEIWVNVDGTFCGGIDAAGKFTARREAPAWLAEELQRLASNPEKETRLYGRMTGVCCCCGRELTDPVSVAAGIGPICASNWGL